MMGTKRRHVSLRSDAEETAFQSKRKSEESPFQSQGLVPSQQQTAIASSLDSQRAASSQQHVRALNTQFASWVQSQLQNHPDELWEDGVRDYLTHASNILEKFSDVVTWLKASTTNGGILPSTKAAAAVPLEKPQDIVTNSISGKSMFSPENKFALPNNSPVLSNSETSAQSKPSLFTWTSGVTTQNQSPSSNANANANASSERASDITKDHWQSATPLSSPWTYSGLFSSSSPSLSSGTSASGGASTVTTSITTPWTSSLFSNNLSPPSSTTPSASAPTWSFGLSPSSQTSFKFGSQSTGPPSEGAATTTNEDADDENEEQPSSPSLKKSEEKGIIVVHEAKCKLYLKSSDPADKDPWKDKGTGQLSIKCKEGVCKGAKESKPTILVRNDVGRILLNALLYPGIKTTSVKSNSIMAIFHTAAEDGVNGNSNEAVARTFLIKTKNEEERNKLAEAIRENAPAS